MVAYTQHPNNRFVFVYPNEQEQVSLPI